MTTNSSPCTKRSSVCRCRTPRGGFMFRGSAQDRSGCDERKGCFVQEHKCPFIDLVEYPTAYDGAGGRTHTATRMNTPRPIRVVLSGTDIRATYPSHAPGRTRRATTAAIQPRICLRWTKTREPVVAVVDLALCPVFRSVVTKCKVEFGPTARSPHREQTWHTRNWGCTKRLLMKML